MAQISTITSLIGSELYSSSLFSDANLKSYWRLEGNSNDSVGTVNGTDTNITYSTSYGKYTQGASFNGTSSRINNTSGIPAMAGQSAITWGGWFLTNTLTMPATTQRIGFAYGSRAGLIVQVFQVGITATSTFVLVGTVSGSQSYIAQESVAPPVNTWRFIVGTYDGSNTKLYIDGVLIATTASTGGVTNSPSASHDSLHIGHIGVTSETDYNDWWSGYIDDLFAFNRALTASEIQTLYGLKAYYKTETGALTTDNANNGFTLTNNNVVAEASGKYGIAADFGSNNTTKSLSIVDNLGIRGGAVSMSIWVKVNSDIADGGDWLFTALEDSTTSTQFGIGYQRTGATRNIVFKRFRQGVAADQITYNVDLGISNFHHLVLTYDTTNLRGYLDNVLVAGPTAFSGNGSGVTAHSFSIGNQRGLATGNGYYASAIIDDIGIFNRALSAAEISLIYTDTTSGVVVPNYAFLM